MVDIGDLVSNLDQVNNDIGTMFCAFFNVLFLSFVDFIMAG